MFESSAFESSPSDTQPAINDYVEDKANIEPASSADSDAYTPSTSAPGEVVHDGRVTAPNNLSLAEVVSQEFRPFDAETLIIHPIMAEESSDERFYKELGEHLIESLLTFHAWAAARPRHEHNVVCELISSKMSKIEETEKDQGRYHTSLCMENDLRLSSVPPSSSHTHHNRSSETEDEERMYPFVDACPHSPPRPVFVCSRTLEQNRRRLADFVEMMTNALTGIAENLRSL